MILRFVNDVHLYSPIACMTLTDLSYAIQSSPYPVVLNGDIVDVANCKYKELPQAYQTLILLGNSTPHRVRGNHECNAVDWPDYIELFEVLHVTHGDRAMWPLQKSEAFRNQKRGAGWFKRNLVSPFINNLRHLLAVRPNDNLLRYVEITKNMNPKIKYMVFGHSHPPETVHFEHAGVSCMILPPGVNDVTLDI